MLDRRWPAVLACVAAGLLMAASLPPVGFWPLAPIGIVVLDRAIAGRSRKSRWLRGALAAAALYVPTLSWMISFTPPGWVIASALFSVIVGLAIAACPPGIGRWVALPGAWLLSEAVRGRWPFGGVPLSTLAIGGVDAPWAGSARLGNALLLSGVTVAAGVALAAALDRRWRSAALLAASVAVVGIAGALAPDGHATGSLRVALVQGGGPIGTSAEDTSEREVFERHLRASADVPDGMDLVVWPEDVVDTDYPVTASREGDELAELARRLDTTLIVGTVEGVGDRFHNAAVAFDSEGRAVDRFEKVRRVPFGEFTPFRSLLERIAGGSLIEREAIAGESPATLDTPVGRLGVVISWEVFFPDRARDAIQNGGEVLLNPTNGSSFKGILVQSQQVAASRLRAIETGRWTLQAAPTGFSAIVKPSGEVVERSGISEARVVVGAIETRDGQTVATRVGDWLALSLGLFLVAAGWAIERRSAPRPPGGG